MYNIRHKFDQRFSWIQQLLQESFMEYIAVNIPDYGKQYQEYLKPVQQHPGKYIIVYRILQLLAYQPLKETRTFLSD